MIVAICGFIGSGKDTIADYLVNFHGFRRESFANSLKDAVSQIFGWDRTLLEGRTKQAREWREQRDEWWSNRLGMNITPRFILQSWGTELCRTGFHNDIWIASLENKLRNCADDVVISDCRFPNEISSIRDAGGLVIRVKRGAEPEWYNDAINFNAGAQRIGWALGKHRLETLGIHPSEYSWLGTDFDAVIENEGTIDELYGKVRSQVLNLPASTAASRYVEFAGS